MTTQTTAQQVIATFDPHAGKVKIPAIRSKQGNDVYYSVVFKAAKLVNDIYRIDNEKSYQKRSQRPLNAKRASGFRKYLQKYLSSDRGVVLPPVIGVTIDRDGTLDAPVFVPFAEGADIGYLYLDQEHIIRLIDGQHRSEGVKELLELLREAGDNPTFLKMVSEIGMTVMLYTDISLDKRKAFFADINTKGTKATGTIVKLYGRDDLTLLVNDLVDDLPFKDRVDTEGGNASGNNLFTFNTIHKATTLITGFKEGDELAEGMVEITSLYWKTVANNMGWDGHCSDAKTGDEIRKQTCYTTSAMLTAIGKAFPILMSQYKSFDDIPFSNLKDLDYSRKAGASFDGRAFDLSQDDKIMTGLIGENLCLAKILQTLNCPLVGKKLIEHEKGFNPSFVQPVIPSELRKSLPLPKYMEEKKLESLYKVVDSIVLHLAEHYKVNVVDTKVSVKECITAALSSFHENFEVVSGENLKNLNKFLRDNLMDYAINYQVNNKGKNLFDELTNVDQTIALLKDAQENPLPLGEADAASKKACKARKATKVEDIAFVSDDFNQKLEGVLCQSLSFRLGKNATKETATALESFKGALSEFATHIESLDKPKQVLLNAMHFSLKDYLLLVEGDVLEYVTSVDSVNEVIKKIVNTQSGYPLGTVDEELHLVFTRFLRLIGGDYDKSDDEISGIKDQAFQEIKAEKELAEKVLEKARLDVEEAEKEQEKDEEMDEELAAVAATFVEAFGISQELANELSYEYDSVEEIKSTPVEEILEVIPSEMAEEVVDFHSKILKELVEAEQLELPEESDEDEDEEEDEVEIPVYRTEEFESDLDLAITEIVANELEKDVSDMAVASHVETIMGNISTVMGEKKFSDDYMTDVQKTNMSDLVELIVHYSVGNETSTVDTLCKLASCRVALKDIRDQRFPKGEHDI